VFSFTQILVCAVIGGIASAVVVYAARRDWRAALEPAIVVALSVVLWRSAANTAGLNDDPIPWVSPNDILCPIVTYVSLALYAAVARRDNDARLRAQLTLVSLVVNVLTI